VPTVTRSCQICFVRFRYFCEIFLVTKRNPHDALQNYHTSYDAIALVFLWFSMMIIESWINSIVGVFAYFWNIGRNGNTSAPAFRIPSVEISSPF
jgi:hypothetical protein